MWLHGMWWDPPHCSVTTVALAHPTALVQDTEMKCFPTSTCIILQNTHPPNILLLAVTYSYLLDLIYP